MHPVTRRRAQLLLALRIACRDNDLRREITPGRFHSYILNPLRNDPQSHYLAFAQDGSDAVSYAVKPADKLKPKSRAKTTLSRYLRRRLKLGKTIWPDHYLAELSGIVYALQDTDWDNFITVVSGSEIQYAYDRDFGEESCMTGAGESEARYLSLYSNNPDRIKLVKYSREQRTARALLWLTNSGKTVLDRIYPNNGYHVHQIRAWAKAKGHINRPHNSLPSDEGVRYDDAIFRVTLDNPEGDFPYMDTFHWGKLLAGDKVELTNKPEEDSEIALNHTDGSYRVLPCHKCDGCDRRVDHLDNTPDEDRLCGDCWSARWYRCGGCGETVLRRSCHSWDYYLLCNPCYQRETIARNEARLSRAEAEGEV